MSEGSGGPWASPQVSVPPGDSSRAGLADPAGVESRVPNFPVERAERGMQFLSRLAGPVLFFLALGAIVWLFVK